MTKSELEQKIENFADEWLTETGSETLTETLMGFDFTSKCYRELSAAEKACVSETEFLDLLQKAIAEKF